MYLIVTNAVPEECDTIGWYASVVHNNKVVGVAKSKKNATNFEIETEEMNAIIDSSKSGSWQVEELVEKKDEKEKKKKKGK